MHLLDLHLFGFYWITVKQSNIIHRKCDSARLSVSNDCFPCRGTDGNIFWFLMLLRDKNTHTLWFPQRLVSPCVSVLQHDAWTIVCEYLRVWPLLGLIMNCVSQCAYGIHILSCLCAAKFTGDFIVLWLCGYFLCIEFVLWRAGGFLCSEAVGSEGKKRSGYWLKVSLLIFFVHLCSLYLGSFFEVLVPSGSACKPNQQREEKERLFIVQL